MKLVTGNRFLEELVPPDQTCSSISQNQLILHRHHQPGRLHSYRSGHPWRFAWEKNPTKREWGCHNFSGEPKITGSRKENKQHSVYVVFLCEEMGSEGMLYISKRIQEWKVGGYDDSPSSTEKPIWVGPEGPVSRDFYPHFRLWMLPGIRRKKPVPVFARPKLKKGRGAIFKSMNKIRARNYLLFFPKGLLPTSSKHPAVSPCSLDHCFSFHFFLFLFCLYFSGTC